ncbi:hypothetical protein FK216_12165 [Moraxellaceae bacterium AER2_44_116]|nr:hypothetical protein FK216_12165 [Moraxellaceae bacterium AER2_44_116]
MPVTGFPIATNNSPNPSNGAGFNYGGELDVTPVSTANVAVFDALTACTIVDNVFTPEGYATACATHIAQEVDAKAQLRFTWPATDENSQLIVGLWTPTSITNVDELSATASAELVAISCVSGILMQTYKELNNSPSSSPMSNEVATGDSILMTLEYGTNILSFVNETQNLGLISCDLGNFPSFAESRSLFIFGNTPVSFDIANNDYPALQVAHEVQAPENSDGKTYLVTGANENSIINGKLLKSGDFVTFFANGTDCVVNRLISDAYLNSLIESQVLSIISTELSTNPNGTLAISIGGVSINAVAAAIAPPDSTPVTISESIANAVESSITEALNPASNGLIAVAIQDFVTATGVTESISTAIDSALQTGGIIDNAIQAAMNP